MTHPSAEVVMPDLPLSEQGDNENIKQLKKLIILKIMRPDRFIA
jgi:hypothetical protein